MDAASNTNTAPDTPPRGYVSITYASSAGQKSAVMLSHGRIFGVLCGSFFIGGWFVVSSLGTLAFTFSPTIRKMVFSSLVAPSHSQNQEAVIGPSAGSVVTPVMDPAQGEVVTSAATEATSALANQGTHLTATPRTTASEQPSTYAPNSEGVASSRPLTRFDRTKVETSSGKLEFRFFLNLLQKGKKQTGRIVARAQFRTDTGKVLNVASTLEGSGVFSGHDPETGIPFTMRHAVRHDLVFLAPENTQGQFISVTAKAYPDGNGSVSSVAIPAL